MKILRTCLRAAIAAFVIFYSGSCASGSAGGKTDINPATLQSALDNTVSENNGRGGGVYCVLNSNGSALFAGVAGDTSSGSGIPMTPQTTFEIASVTKTFTAVTVLLLAEDGKLLLDSRLGNLLASNTIAGLLTINGNDMSADITVRQLLSHTSGLPNYWTDPPYLTADTNAFLQAFMADPNRFWTPEEILTYARKLDPIGPPGGDYHYSDTNYVLLGLIVEKLAGKSLDQVYRDRILTPLGMADTYLSYHESPVSSAVESHRYEGSEDLYGKKRQSADWAGGGLVSSCTDLGRFATALFEGKIFAHPETLAEMKKWVPTGDAGISYGLGIFHVELSGGGELIGHDGHGNSFMYYLPSNGMAIAGTLNQTENDWWPLAEAFLAESGY